MITDTFARNLRQFRKEAGLTQGELGMKAGYNRKTINYHEKGRQIPNLIFLEDMAVALGRTPVEMITERKT